ncbi:unnamed protein product [Anisakis simplex]|uniref:Ferritin n=1 Tax=Anisakis simplex TaxID=6269 RepID=A0A0M3JY59_ANISI|nr:unnamed protein product [Anisakis simplex]
MASNGSETSIRQNYSVEVEAALNKQISVELFASYTYLSMATYFDRDDVALLNVAKWMRKQSEEEREHAMMLMKYQNSRGGRVVLQDIKKPVKDEWGSLQDAFKSALELEKFNNTSLLDLHSLASSHNDAHMSDFLEEHYLRDQVESIEQIAKFITNIKRAGPGLGEYIFDRENFDD